jgi:hypothetical protein
MATEELVDRSGRRDVEVPRDAFESAAVRAGAMQSVGKVVVTTWVLLFEGAIGQDERAGVGGQARVGREH